MLCGGKTAPLTFRPTTLNPRVGARHPAAGGDGAVVVRIEGVRYPRGVRQLHWPTLAWGDRTIVYELFHYRKAKGRGGGHHFEVVGLGLGWHKAVEASFAAGVVHDCGIAGEVGHRCHPDLVNAAAVR